MHDYMHIYETTMHALLQKSESAKRELKEKSKQILSVLRKLEHMIDAPKVVNSKKASKGQEACFVHCKTSQVADDQNVKLTREELTKQVDFVKAEANSATCAENDKLSDYEHQPDSGLVEGCVIDEERVEDVDELRRAIAALKTQVKELNENIDTLRRHSREQSRQVLKYKQESEVSEVSSIIIILKCIHVH